MGVPNLPHLPHLMPHEANEAKGFHLPLLPLLPHAARCPHPVLLPHAGVWGKAPPRREARCGADFETKNRTPWQTGRWSLGRQTFGKIWERMLKPAVVKNEPIRHA